MNEYTGIICSVSALTAVRPVHLCVFGAREHESYIVDDFFKPASFLRSLRSVCVCLSRKKHHKIFHIVSIEFKFNSKNSKTYLNSLSLAGFVTVSFASLVSVYRRARFWIHLSDQTD